MRKLLGFIGIHVGGFVGWWLGAHVGLVTAAFLAAFGTGAGLYVGRRLFDDYFG